VRCDLPHAMRADQRCKDQGSEAFLHRGGGPHHRDEGAEEEGITCEDVYTIATIRQLLCCGITVGWGACRLRT